MSCNILSSGIKENPRSSSSRNLDRKQKAVDMLNLSCMRSNAVAHDLQPSLEWT